MARGTQFLELLTRLKDETGRSSETAIGVDDEDSLKTSLNRWYESLYLGYDWPFLKKTFDRQTLSAGQEHYDFPSGLDLERVEQVTLWYNGIGRTIERGISLQDYNTFNSFDDERSDPVLKWDVRYTTSEQIEVWPIPANTQYLQFIGFLQHDRLVGDADICRLDDTLVISFTAAQILQRQESKDADMMLAFANKHLNTLRSRGKVGERTYRMGLGTGQERTLPRATVQVSS